MGGEGEGREEQKGIRLNEGRIQVLQYFQAFAYV